MRFICVIVGLVLCLVPPAPATLQLGSTREEVLAEHGLPKGEMTANGVLVMTYDGGVVELKKGRVIYIQPGFEKRAADRAAEAAFEAAQNAKGLVKYNGEWITQREAEHRQKEAAIKQNAVQEIRQKGASVDLKKIIVPGKITIVDFFADWCGPCKKLGPELENLARADRDLCLRKIDIVNWKSEVVKQYKINSVPNVWVFDRKGNLVGPPTSGLPTVKNYVQQAKAR